MTREVDLQALRLIIELDRHASIRAAGQRLGISQPAASMCLRAFEARWGLRVAERSARGTILTSEGTTVAALAVELVGHVDSLRDNLSALAVAQAGEAATFGIAASLTVAEFLLPRWLGELHERQVEVHPRLEVVNSDSVVDQVRAGSCDLGFVEAFVVAQDLAQVVIGSDRLVLVVHAGHPWAQRGAPLDRAELLGERYVLREHGSGTRDTFERALGEKPRLALVATSTAALVGAAIAGVGPAVLTHHAVQGPIRRGELVEVSHELDLERPLTAVWQRGQKLHGAATSLLTIALRDGRLR